MGTARILQPQQKTAFTQGSLAVHSRISEVSASDVATDRSDLRRLNPPSDLSPARTLAGMRRLIDSDRTPAFSLLVSHPCSYTRGRSVGAFSSVRRAGRLRIADGHAGNRVSDIHEGPLGCRGTNFTASSTRLQTRRVMSLQPPTAALSDLERARSRSARRRRPDRGMSCPALSGPRKQGLPPWECTTTCKGAHGFVAPTTDPSGSSARRRADLVFGKSANPRPEPSMSDPQVLRFCQAGHCYPPRQARTNRDLPTGAPRAANRSLRVPGSTEEPPWIPRQGRRDDPQALVCGEPDARVSSPSIH